VEEPVADAAPDEPVVEEPSRDEPIEVEEPDAGEIRVSRLGDDEATQVLDAMLDTLGAAHHRPFSRS
jgi:hypothetical protein